MHEPRSRWVADVSGAGRRRPARWALVTALGAWTAACGSSDAPGAEGVSDFGPPGPDDAVAGGASGDAASGGAGAAGGEPDADAALDGSVPDTGGGEVDATAAGDAGGGPDPDARVVPPVFGTCGRIADLVEEAVATETGFSLAGTSRGAAQTEVAACGGNGRELAYRFTAPEPGEYRFAVTPAAADDGVSFEGVVYLRRLCEDPTSELACDVGAVGESAAVTVLLAADESVVVFADAVGAFTGGAFDLDVTLDRPGAPGEACTPDGGPNECAPALRCLAVDGTARCRIVVSPEVSEARLMVDPVRRTLGLRLAGLDAGEDVTALVLEAVDAAGLPVSLGPRPPGGLRAFTALAQADGAFQGAFTQRGDPFGPPTPAVAAVTIEVLDAAGLRSPPLRVEAEPPSARGPGEACDVERIFDACAAGTLCDDGLCRAPVEACPENFGALPLEVGAPRAGDTRRAPDVATAACGGTGGDGVYVLTAETAGFHVVEAWSEAPMVAPLLFARSACGAEDPLAARGCAMLDREGRARLGFELAAGERVAVFVTAQDETAGGAYSVQALRPAAPVLDSAEVFVNAEAQVLGLLLSGQDPDRDVRAVGLRLFDADGNDLLGDGAPVDLPLAAGETTLRPGGLVSVRASRRLGLDAGALAWVEVSLVDAYGARSAAQRLPAVPTPVVARGEVCDADGAFFACVAPDRCSGAMARVPDPEGTCQEGANDCPAEFEGVVLLSDPLYVVGAASWRFDGNTRGNVHRTSGSCGGVAAPEDIFVFEAPADGLFEFRTTLPQGGDTILYLRSACGVAGPEAELGCNDDAPDAGDFGSSVTVALAEGEVVYAFVDGFGQAGVVYTLTVEVLR